MTLTMRPTGLGARIDKDRPDYTRLLRRMGGCRIYEVTASTQ